MKLKFMTMVQAALLAVLTIAGAYASSAGSQRACSDSAVRQECASRDITTAARKRTVAPMLEKSAL